MQKELLQNEIDYVVFGSDAWQIMWRELACLKGNRPMHFIRWETQRAFQSWIWHAWTISGYWNN